MVQNKSESKSELKTYVIYPLNVVFIATENLILLKRHGPE